MTVALAALALFLGASLQSATGFGFALVSAPILFALLGPREAVTAGVIVGILSARSRSRRRAAARKCERMTPWRSWPGRCRASRSGCWGLHEVPEQPLSVLVALAVLTGLALRVRARRAAQAPRPRPWHVPVAGATSGALSTSTSLSGPPLVFCMLPRVSAAGAAARHARGDLHRRVADRGAGAAGTGTFAAPPAVGLLLLAGLAGQLLGGRAFGWLQGDRYERAVLAALAATALVALGSTVF